MYPGTGTCVEKDSRSVRICKISTYSFSLALHFLLMKLSGLESRRCPLFEKINRNVEKMWKSVVFDCQKWNIYELQRRKCAFSCGGRCSCRNWPILRVGDVLVRCARPPSMGVIGQLEGPPTAEVCFPQGYPGTGICVEKDSRNVRMGEPQNLTSPINIPF